jgi:peptidoglycan/xylan/chitin deacetylase (PgdA/CDA1 family)
VTISRRGLLGLGLVAGASLAGCTRAVRSAGGPVSGTSPPAGGTGSTAPASTARPSRPATPSAAARTPAATGPATEYAGGPAAGGQVALTFHGAGDPAIAHQLLAIFAGADARVTVLAVGTWLLANPAIGGQILAAGHELGNHTYQHLDIDNLDRQAAQSEIVRCRDLLRSQTGSPGAHFRPSQTQHASAQVLQLAGAAGYRTCLSYNLDSLDYTDPGPAAVRANVARAVAGDIVSLHFGHPGTVAAMPGILADLKARGLRPVTATELLHR